MHITHKCPYYRQAAARLATLSSNATLRAEAEGSESEAKRTQDGTPRASCLILVLIPPSISTSPSSEDPPRIRDIHRLHKHPTTIKPATAPRLIAMMTTLSVSMTAGVGAEAAGQGFFSLWPP